MPLHITYRPETLDEFYGNDALVESLGLVLAREPHKIPSSFLFTGRPGTGKTTLAQILQGALGIHETDFYSYNTANTRGIDTIRDVITDAHYAPAHGEKKAYFFDECHKITVDAWNALLTFLEEPPAHVHFILATAEFEIIKPTLREAVQRRCHQYEPKPLVRGEVLSLLHDICGAEGLEPLNPVLEEIVLMSNGSPGKALKMLDEVIDIEDPRVAVEALQTISTGGKQTEDLVKILIDPSTSGSHKWERARAALENFSGDAEQTRRGILNYIEAIMLNPDTTMQQSMRLFKIQSLFFDSFMYIGRAGLTSATLLACESGRTQDDIPF